MKLRKRMLLKIVAGVLLVALSAFIAVAIRDALAYQAPENSLPGMDVVFGDSDDKLPSVYIRRDKFIWRFLYGTREGGGLDLEIWREIESGWVPPESPLTLVFTYTPRQVRVSVAVPEREFYEVVGPLVAPSTPGQYIYKVEASWGQDKYVTYYFRIRVPTWDKGGA